MANRYLRPTVCVAALLVLTGSWSAAALADDAPARPSFSKMLNVDALLDNYVRFVARKYNLTEEQEGRVAEMVTQKTSNFMAAHKDELFSKVDRLFEVRGGAEMSQDELVRWGQEALPLYEKAKSIVLEGNDEFRSLLTEEQKKIHDEDVALMHKTFAQTDEQIARIISGDMTIEEFRRGGRPNPGEGNRPAPSGAQRKPGQRQNPTNRVAGAAPNAQPAAGSSRSGSKPNSVSPNPSPSSSGELPSASEEAERLREISKDGRPAREGEPSPTGSEMSPGAGGRRSAGEDVHGKSASRGEKKGDSGAQPLSQWEKYVQDFIKRYQLNEQQTEKAMTILKDCQERAQRHLDSKKPEIEQLDAEMAKLSAIKDSKERTAKTTELKEKKSKLSDPVDQIFERQLKARLEKLPTRAQRRAGDAAGGDKGKAAASKAPEGSKTKNLTKANPKEGANNPGETKTGKPGQKSPENATDQPTEPQDSPEAESDEPAEEQP